MDFGLEAGKQAFEVAKAFNELYVEQDEDDDCEMLDGAEGEKENQDQGDEKRSEVVQQVLRVNHLAQQGRLEMAQRQESIDREFADKMGDQNRDNLKKLSTMMPEERSRPSILEPSRALLGTILQCSSSVLSKDLNDLLVGGVEKGIQDEIDEQLRILNENNVEDKEVRKLIIKMRDESYDLMSDSGKLERIEHSIEDKKSNEYMLFTGSKWATISMMRLARQI